MEKQEKGFSTKKLAIIGLMSALVFVFSWMQIPFGEVARLHLGNVFCALSGLLFGPLTGGLASGIGSMLFDFTNPAYIAESWITFITKFFIGFLAGLIANKMGKNTAWKDILGAVAGSFTYVVLYLAKSFIMKLWIEGQALDAVKVQLVTKGVTSSINAVIAVVASVLLALALRPALRHAHILPSKEDDAVQPQEEEAEAK